MNLRSASLALPLVALLGASAAAQEAPRMVSVEQGLVDVEREDGTAVNLGPGVELDVAPGDTVAVGDDGKARLDLGAADVHVKPGGRATVAATDSFGRSQVEAAGVVLALHSGAVGAVGRDELGEHLAVEEGDAAIRGPGAEDASFTLLVNGEPTAITLKQGATLEVKVRDGATTVSVPTDSPGSVMIAGDEFLPGQEASLEVVRQAPGDGVTALAVAGRIWLEREGEEPVSLDEGETSPLQVGDKVKAGKYAVAQISMPGNRIVFLEYTAAATLLTDSAGGNPRVQVGEIVLALKADTSVSARYAVEQPTQVGIETGVAFAHGAAEETCTFFLNADEDEPAEIEIGRKDLLSLRRDDDGLTAVRIRLKHAPDRGS